MVVEQVILRAMGGDDQEIETLAEALYTFERSTCFCPGLGT